MHPAVAGADRDGEDAAQVSEDRGAVEVGIDEESLAGYATDAEGAFATAADLDALAAA